MTNRPAGKPGRAASAERRTSAPSEYPTKCTGPPPSSPVLAAAGRIRSRKSPTSRTDSAAGWRLLA